MSSTRRKIKLDKNKFVDCSRLSDFKMNSEDQVGLRAISGERKRQWAVECANEHKELGEKAPVCIWGNAFLKHVKYIPFPEFYEALIASWKSFIAQQGKRPFAIFLDPDKYGSEYWILQMLWRTAIEPIEQAVLISHLSPGTDPQDIVILDDALYTGVHAFGALDDAFHSIHVHAPGDYRFHFVIPYITNQARNYITENLSKPAVFFYPTAIIPTLIEYDEPVLKTSAYVLNERKKYLPIEEVVKEFDIKRFEDMDLTPLYFDFKIAKNASTATKLLEELVRPLPSRRSLKSAEECHRRFDR
jgi:hypothetical protein